MTPADQLTFKLSLSKALRITRPNFVQPHDRWRDVKAVLGAGFDGIGRTGATKTLCSKRPMNVAVAITGEGDRIVKDLGERCGVGCRLCCTALP
jgi:hypothetical protein